MSNYTKATNFLAKDSMAPGDPLKIVRGSEIDAEFTAIASAIATKVDSSDAPFSFRNKIINGNFDIWQRGTSSASSGYFAADRWYSAGTLSSWSQERQSFAVGQSDVPGGPRYFYRVNVTSASGAAGSYVTFYQRIEGVRQLANGNCVVSFWAKADAAKQVAVNIGQVFGTGGSPSAAVFLTAQKVSLTTAWQKFELTFAVPSISGKTLGSNGNDCLQIEFWCDAGSDWNSRTNSLGSQAGTFDFAQIQVEEGSVATPFEQRPIGLELSLCERYYQTGSYGGTTVCYSTGLWIFKLELQTSLRASPNSYSFTASGGSHSDLSSGWAANSPYINGLRFLRSGGSSATPNVGYVDGTYTVDAEL